MLLALALVLAGDVPAAAAAVDPDDPCVELLRTHEDAEGVSRRVGENVKRFTRFVGAVQEHDGPDFFGSPAVQFQFVGSRHAKIQMHLLGNIGRRPGRSRQRENSLEGEHTVAVTVD